MGILMRTKILEDLLFHPKTHQIPLLNMALAIRMTQILHMGLTRLIIIQNLENKVLQYHNLMGVCKPQWLTLKNMKLMIVRMVEKHPIKKIQNLQPPLLSINNHPKMQENLKSKRK